MYKKNYFKSLLLLAMLLSGAGSTWAQNVTYDIADASWTVSDGALTNGEISFVGEGPDNFKKNTGYFMMGKSGAYINFPTYEKAVEKIVVTGNSSASASTVMNIFVGDNAVSTATTGSKGTNTYEIGADYQAAGTQYTLKVTSAHNAQITKIEVYFASEAGVAKPTFTPAAGTYSEAQSVTISCATSGATIYYTLDGEEPTDQSTEYTGAINVSETTTIKAIAYDATGASSNVASATYNILSIGHAGTEADPYTVADARAAIDLNTGVTGVYAKGIVSKIVTAFNSQFGNISYNISEDGTEEADQLEAYRGFSYDGKWFTSEDDIQVGDEVVIYGNLTKYGSTYEFAQNNQLVSLVRPQASQDPVINAEDVELAYDATSGEIAFTIDNPVEGYNVTVATPDVDWISDVAVSADANVITFTTTVNEGTEAREGHITINYGGTTVEASKVVKVTQGINENIQPVAVDGSYVKVTSTDDITDGQYLIVYEGNDTHDAVAFNGGLETLDAANNIIAVTIENDEIAASEATQAAEFTINVADGTIKSASGLYIGKTAYDNGLNASAETQYTNTFAITNDEAVITASGNCTLRYNYASDQLRFRYYKSGQQAIQLYKYVEDTPEEPEVKYYLVGSWGENNAGWDTENPQVEMTNNNGVYSVTYNIAAGTEFKVIKKFENELTWYGGNNNPQEITKNGEIKLSSPGENFKINTEGEYTFSVNTTGTALTLTVTGFPAQQFFLAGNWENGWSADGMIQFEAGETEGEYTLTQELEANAEFKVVSEGKWYRSENPALTKENNNVALNTYDDEVNMTLPSAGTYTFTLQDTPNGLFLTVTFPEPVVKYALVTDVTKLEAGKKILFVGEKDDVYYAMGAQNNNNRAAVKVEVANGIITPGEGVEASTLVANEDGTWSFLTAVGYLYAASNSSNHLKSEAEIDDYAKATIEIDNDNLATILFGGGRDRNDLRFNSTNNPLIFSCYATSSNMNHVYIYMETSEEVIPETVTAEVSVAGLATFCSEWALDFTGIEEVYAYKVSVNEKQISYTRVYQVPAETGVVLRSLSGDAISVEVPVIESADEIADNALVAVLEAIESLPTDGDGCTNYILNNLPSKGVGFYKANNQPVGAGKAYLQVEGTLSKDFIGFADGVATGIETIDNGWTVDNEIYDLQGRKVMNPTKGIFIQNGRKVVIK